MPCYPNEYLARQPSSLALKSAAAYVQAWCNKGQLHRQSLGGKIAIPLRLGTRLWPCGRLTVPIYSIIFYGLQGSLPVNLVGIASLFPVLLDILSSSDSMAHNSKPLVCFNLVVGASTNLVVGAFIEWWRGTPP